MIRVFLFMLLTILLNPVFSQDKKMCISIDDLPVVSYGIEDPDFHRYITGMLLGHFGRYDVPAIGYVNESKLYRNGRLDPDRVNLLESWLKAGYELGNHTYSHMNYHKTSYRKYTTDILRGEEVTRRLVDRYDSELKFFRHPYLRSGENKSRSDSLENFLQINGYIPAPVSIDNDDYLFAKAYHDASLRNDSVMMEKIGHSFIDYMEKKLLYFEHSSMALFGRNISHILLLHASQLNADFLDELLSIYVRHGYRFISQGEALADPVYQEEITRFGDWGISWLDRCALSQGKKGDFFRDEPVVPEFIQALNQDNSY
jgi:peptidoglycan/xylan/chitin deacetylase (PgdA/CDA1 family)